MLNNSKTIDKLKRYARKSPLRHKHAAGIIDTKGNLIAVAHNKRNHINNKSTHAEIASIENYIKVWAPQGRKIDYLIVIRINPNGGLVNSKPCIACSATLTRLGINVIHS